MKKKTKHSTKENLYFKCNTILTTKQSRVENCTQCWRWSPDSSDIHGSL